jgi:hypothetical protein
MADETGKQKWVSLVIDVFSVAKPQLNDTASTADERHRSASSTLAMWTGA